MKKYQFLYSATLNDDFTFYEFCKQTHVLESEMIKTSGRSLIVYLLDNFIVL
jgi:hypothetical protein